ncbi:hypothetical protein [Sphingomicrobium astaxanthinifaciens]|uniref:hypothetical protein n=1 Tax=Sphingomicrobium astaxanthinifaciens TaxID=1227949 RepID=UPI001FCB79E0|nr:hypothetical protein [Sphingomicrobium astaxanthinifaciens]MCJ7420462.1 hypothetical protein [Sphingomicrobium astaxanthinifaciens]
MSEREPSEPIVLQARTRRRHPRWHLPAMLAQVVLAAWLAGLLGRPPVSGLILWGWLALPVVVMASLALLLRPSGRTLGLRIDGEGIVYPAYHPDRIDWQAVEEIRTLGAGEGEAVLFDLRDAPAGGGSRPVGISRVFGFGNFGVRTDDLDCTLDEVATAAQRNFRLAQRTGRFKPREVRRDAEGRRRTVGFGKGRGLRL